MNFKNIFLLAFLSFSIIACTDSDDDQLANELPECVKTLLVTFSGEYADCEGANVSHYLYQEIDVYTFKDGLCITDGGIRVVDEGCSDICFLGGIAGFTECNGEDWSAGAVLQEVIWESNE